MFVECPVAAAVWRWYAQLWQRAQPGAVVPVDSSRVLLLDDLSVWAPPAAQLQLWTHLRLLLLEAIWVVRCSCGSAGQVTSSVGGSDSNGGHNTGSSSHSQRHSRSDMDGGSSSGSMGSQRLAAGETGSPSYTAKAVACRFRAELQQQMQREWDRVEIDVRLGCGIPFAWLRGRSPEIPLVDFWQKWGALYRVGADGRVKVWVSTAGL